MAVWKVACASNKANGSQLGLRRCDGPMTFGLGLENKESGAGGRLGGEEAICFLLEYSSGRMAPTW